MYYRTASGNERIKGATVGKGIGAKLAGLAIPLATARGSVIDCGDLLMLMWAAAQTLLRIDKALPLKICARSSSGISRSRIEETARSIEPSRCG